MLCSTVQCGLLLRVSLWLPGCTPILLIVKTSCCAVPAGAAELLNVSASHGAGSKGSVLAGLQALSGIRRAQQRAACLLWDNFQGGDMLCVQAVEPDMRAGVHLLGWCASVEQSAKGCLPLGQQCLVETVLQAQFRVLPAGPVHKLEHEGTGADLQGQPPRFDQVPSPRAICSSERCSVFINVVLHMQQLAALRQQLALTARRLSCRTTGSCMGCFKVRCSLPLTGILQLLHRWLTPCCTADKMHCRG